MFLDGDSQHFAVLQDLVPFFLWLNRETGTSLIMVTHNLQLAGRMQRQLVLREGQLGEE